MVGKTFKKAIAKAVASVTTAALCAGCFSAIGFAAQPANPSAGLLLDYDTDVLSLVMDSTQEELNQDPYENLIVSNYDPYLSIYEENDAASKVVGKLYPGSYGEIVEKGDQWTKIKSGDVTGYVLSKDVAFGEDAEKLAQDIGKKVVKVTVDELNIRSGPNFYSEVIASGKKDETYRIVPEGSEYKEETDEISWLESEDSHNSVSQEDIASDEHYNEQNEEPEAGPTYEEMITPVTDSDGGQWYRIHLNDIYYGYVYADCVNVENQLNDAITPEEEAQAQSASDDAAAQANTSENAQTAVSEQTQSSQSQADSTQQTSTAQTQTAQTQETQTQETETVQTQAPETEAASTASSDDAYLLACLVYCEAGNQTYEGQLAVANIVLNRVKSPLFPNSVSEVIYQSGQFGPVYNGSLNRTLANGPSSACVQAANDALAGNNNIGNLLFFNNYAPSNASSVTTIGDIVFYTYNY